MNELSKNWNIDDEIIFELPQPRVNKDVLASLDPIAAIIAKESVKEAQQSSNNRTNKVVDTLAPLILVQQARLAREEQLERDARDAEMNDYHASLENARYMLNKLKGR